MVEGHLGKLRIEKTKIEGCYKITPNVIEDDRGYFVKNFNYDFFISKDLKTNFVEDYFSQSKKGVIRGMHFQLPPYDHEKLVICISGEILDVVLDIRKDSSTYGKYETFNINSESFEMIFLSKGLAHGFYTKSDNALVYYKVTSTYEPHSDSGIKWNSFGMKWPSDTPLISSRDNSFEDFNNFVSPFVI
tara:strand:+ start:331 stop:897 length:567 start_codon:yes stop_codon:yes gene_type:complete